MLSVRRAYGAPAIKTVGAMVEFACDYVSEGAPFSEVLLVADDVELEGVERVESAAELAERLNFDLPRPRQSVTDVLAHARWSKSLVDDLQAQIDRALWKVAPSPALDQEPLVTVRIPTYGSADLLVQRAIPSVLNGAYQNVELLVCSDGPQPHAREAVEAIEDPRVRYVELPERPSYPSSPFSFWRVAGIAAINRLLDEARGDVIAPLDHDDAFTRDHIPVLLDALRRKSADFSYGPAMTEWINGAWSLLGEEPLAHGGIVHATVMYTRRLAHMRYDADAWLRDEPGDWNLWRRMRDTGAGVAFVPDPVAVHFREGTSVAGRENPRDLVAAAAEDVLKTDARRLLEVATRPRGVARKGRSSGKPATRRARS